MIGQFCILLDIENSGEAAAMWSFCLRSRFANVRFWHKGDMAIAFNDVRFWG